MRRATSGSRWDRVGHATTVGLAFGPFALLFSVWIPSLALILGTIAIVAGSLDARGGSGRRVRFARLAIGLGILAIVATAFVVIVSTPSGATNGTSGPAPA
jgi:hypothetical protein